MNNQKRYYCTCKNCKQQAIIDTDVICTTFPPQYRYHCEHCEDVGWVSLRDTTIGNEFTSSPKSAISIIELELENLKSQNEVNLKVLVDKVLELAKETKQLEEGLEKLTTQVQRLDRLDDGHWN